MTIQVLAFALIIGVASGAFAGVLGVGGGVIVVPALVLGMGLDQQVAQGTSLLVIVPTALVGTYVNARRGLLQWRTVLLLSAGGVPGVLVGTTAALSVPGGTLRLIFAAYMGIVGARMLWTSRGRGRLIRQHAEASRVRRARE